VQLPQPTPETTVGLVTLCGSNPNEASRPVRWFCCKSRAVSSSSHDTEVAQPFWSPASIWLKLDRAEGAGDHPTEHLGSRKVPDGETVVKVIQLLVTGITMGSIYSLVLSAM